MQITCGQCDHQIEAAMIHGASGWLLRTWGFKDEVERTDQTAPDFDKTGQRDWFVRKVGDHYLTFVVFQPGSVTVGSPESEETRRPMEEQKTMPIRRAFAVCDREVTRKLFLEFTEAIGQGEKTDVYGPTAEHPVVGPTWFEAVSFCRWLTSQATLDEEDQCYTTIRGTADPRRATTVNRRASNPTWDFES